MKSFRTLLILVVTSVLLMPSCRQQGVVFKTQMATDANGYTYEYVTNDDSGTRIYTLGNGLKVYMSVYKTEPRIQVLMPVKAGGKFDPANSTGLAHYLEHMMFKGTTKFGTKNWEQEAIYVDSLEQMFEHYRTLTDAEERKTFYASIDAYSNEASRLAIANEYDRMMAYLGAKGTNAYTTEDRTVYMENIPSNQLENFFQIQADRFSTIVNRLFHTELEAVYEEKNRSLDNDRWKVQERLMACLFPNHPYGTQTVIGTIEHLKNPSIKDINAYFHQYYVPNNMAVCLSGDFDPEAAIKVIDQYMGQLPAKPLDDYQAPQSTPLTEIVNDTVYGPNQEFVQFGFRAPGTTNPDYLKLQLVDYILTNSTAGLIDLNLVQKQKILNGYSYVNQMNDYSIHMFNGEPREGQSLEEVRDLLLQQIDLVKKGEFEDWLVEAVINDFKKSHMRSLESNRSRASDMVMAFTNNLAWEDYVGRIAHMEKINKAELVEFANKYYQNNYVAIFKKTGEDPNKMQVEKPQITKVELDRASKSPFYEGIEAREVPPIKPVFVNYQQDIQHADIDPGIPVLSMKNQENQLFTLYYLLDFGTNENPKIELALNYLKYLGTSDLSPEDVKKTFYKLGCDFEVFSSEERIYVTLSGLSENMVPAMQLFEKLLADPQPDEGVLKNVISDAHKERSDAKKEKGNIFWGGLMNYAKYGSKSPFTNVLSNEELDRLQSGELITMIKDIPQTQHRILYYGPMDQPQLVQVLQENHQTPGQLKPLPARVVFDELDTNDPHVFFTNYDMVQAEIVFQSRGQRYDPKIAPEVRMFNEYFGGGMASVVFQEIREAQGLAYSVFSSYQEGDKKGDSDYMMAYVGTQADKQPEAMDALIDLINNMPESEQSFSAAKTSILKKIESERITKTGVLFSYLNAQEKGLDYDIRQDVYSRVQEMTFANLKAFHEKYVKDKKYNVAIIGDRNKVNFVALSKYGAVQELSLDELFGYEEKSKELLN